MTHFARALARREAAIRRQPRPTSSASPSCATSCGRCRTRTGPSRSTSSGASRCAWQAFARARKTRASRSSGGRRRGRRHRQVRDFSRPDRAGPRAPRLHAARGRPSQGSARGIRSDDEEGAESLPWQLWRRPRGRARWRSRQGARPTTSSCWRSRKKPIRSGRSWRRRRNAVRVERRFG